MTHPPDLAALIEAGLIQANTEAGSGEYAFRHALIHDAAYASLLRSERRTLHGRVGRALEDDLPADDDPRAVTGRLGEHFSQAGDFERARRYFARAAEGARRTYAHAEATALYRRALEAGEAGAEPEQLEPLLLGLGESLELAGRHDEALDAYQRLLGLAQRHARPRLELAARMARAKIHATLTPLHDPASARDLLEQSRQLARRLEDPSAEARVLWNLMVLLTWGGQDFDQAIDLGRRAADLARRAGADETLAFSLNDLVYPLVATRRYPEARQASAAAQELWRNAANLPMLVDSLSSQVLLDYAFGEFDRGQRAAAEAIRVSEEIDNLWGRTNSRLYLGQIQRDRGLISDAIETLQTAIDLGDRSRHPGALIASRVDLGLLLAELGDPQAGRSWLDQAASIASDLSSWLRAYPPAGLALLEAGQERWPEAERAAQEAHRRLSPTGLQWFAPTYLALAQASIDLAGGSLEKAERGLEALRADLDSTPERPFLPDAWALTSRVRLAQGRPHEAVACAEAAVGFADELGARWRLWPALVALSDARRAAGDSDGAREAVVRARQAVGKIVEETPDGVLRESFVRRGPVAALLRR